jgi:uncharacterized Zn finger protein
MVGNMPDYPSPMNDDAPKPYKSYKYIVAHPDLLGGKLTIKHTRISVSHVLECLATGMDALDSAGRKDEILPLCSIEARATGSWQRYVKRLIASKKRSEARAAAEEGIKQLGNKWPGITKSLRESIAKLAEGDGDYTVLLNLRRNEFLEYPSVSGLKELRNTAAKTKNWSEMRQWAQTFLESGIVGALKPECEDSAKLFGRSQSFPLYGVLIDIAIDEKEPEQVLRWYDEAVKKKAFYGGYDAAVANAIEKSHPERALAIWRRMAEHQISLTKPSAYEAAVGHLKRVKTVMIRLGKEKEWGSYLAALRDANQRKPRCIQELRRLSGERLLN